MVHSSISKPQVITSVLSTGYAGNLAKGQLAFVKDKAKKGLGAEVVADFAGMNKKERISIRIGEATTPSNLRIQEVPNKSTGFFPLESILSIKSHIPSQVELKVDHLEVGYDGINADSALYIPEGKSATFDIAVYGEVASTFFGASEFLISKEAYRAEGETMQEVTRRLVKELKEERVPSATGFASVTDELAQFLEIGIIDSSTDNLAGTAWTFSSITVNDGGESGDLGAIQAQYSAYKVKRTAREGRTSTYTILHPSTVTLANATLVEIDINNKGCATCPATYTQITGGYVYSISLEDDGTSQTALIDDLPGYVALSAEKVGNDNGVGTYLVVVTAPLTEAQKDTFLAINTIAGTASFTELGKVEDVCSKSTTTTYTWTAGEVCNTSVKQFSIVLPDNECGESRLTELQLAYPELVVEEGIPTGTATQTVTLAVGATTGNLAVTVNGTTYTTANSGTAAATATAFVAAHAAAILAATGAVITNPSTGVVLFTDSAEGFPTIVITASTLTTLANTTVGALDYLTTTATGGCKRTYSTSVTSNLVCDECSDIYLQPFEAEAPDTFQGIAWEEIIPAYDENAKMGIFVKGKPFYITPESYEEDFVPYVETSLKVKSISFGAHGSLLLNYDGSIYDPDTEFAPVRKLQYAQDVNNDAQALFGAERMGNQHFANKTLYKKNLLARTNLSQERLLQYSKKYVQYAVKYIDNGLSQMGGSRSDITHEFRIIVEYGKHTALESILNSLAGKLGLDAVNVIY